MYWSALEEDVNTPLALSIMHRLSQSLSRLVTTDAGEELIANAEFLGVMMDDMSRARKLLTEILRGTD